MVTREELYALVWSQPMTKIAEKFDVSGSYMARVCSSLKVPRPERGYWAKLAFGKAPANRELPDAQPGDPLVWDNDLGGDSIPKPVPKPPMLSPKRRVNRPVRGIHPLIVAGKPHFSHVRPDDEGKLLRPFKRLMLDVTASKASLEKALGFANDLFNALEARGYRVTLAPVGREFRRDAVDYHEVPNKKSNYSYHAAWYPERPTLVYLDTIAVGISIIEMTEEVLMRYVHGKYIPDADYSPPKSARYPDHTWTTTQQIPSGRLRLKIYAPYQNVSWSCEFKETTERTLTTDIPAIIKVIEDSAVAMVARLEDAARREEEWRAQQREERRRRLEEEDRRKIAQSKKDSHEQLTQVISAWSKAVTLESFFRGVEGRATLLSGNETLVVLDRLKLAREFVGPHDPLAFFLQWKTPIELYVPAAMRTDYQEGD